MEVFTGVAELNHKKKSYKFKIVSCLREKKLLRLSFLVPGNLKKQLAVNEKRIELLEDDIILKDNKLSEMKILNES